MKKRWKLLLFWGMVLSLGICIGFSSISYAKRDVVIVIDPGHGGSNMGARHNGVIEKEATMKVALAMKEELEKYEGVVVYLTREDNDTSLELLQRAEFARDRKADIVISLHFNMSELHDLHGSEMWISSSAPLRGEAERFAKIEQMLLSDYGIERRGCYTRLNDEGADYYGIIRESSNFKIPAVLVEHCYLDRIEEEEFYDTDAALDRLGRIDATAVAMSYGLSSEELGVDYRRHYISNTELPERLLQEDTTAPENVILEIEGFESETNVLKLRLQMEEKESTMMYYQYSFNGGKTFSNPIPFFNEREIQFATQVFPSTDSEFMVRSYNAYGLYTDSEIINLNEVIFHITPKYVDSDSVLTSIFTFVEDEMESITQGISPETRSAATWTVIIGVILGVLVPPVLLTLQKYPPKQELKDYRKSA